MNLHHVRPDRSPEAVARRRKATDQARAANVRQGYVFDGRVANTFGGSYHPAKAGIFMLC
ncbi:TPA: hypothetical protein GF216_004995 [Escherichia coli]|nr:hypothetical protein [Escherichia coli]HAG5638943.1 hypothetical protein [Escherichia coli]